MDYFLKTKVYTGFVKKILKMKKRRDNQNLNSNIFEI